MLSKKKKERKSEKQDRIKGDNEKKRKMELMI
jgi:hypothetical protein